MRLAGSERTHLKAHEFENSRQVAAHVCALWLTWVTIPFVTAKFLVDPAGKVVERYGPQVPPSEIEKDITPLLPA